MQEALTVPHFWAWLVGAFFTGVGVLAGIYKIFLERKKPQAEIHESQARARLSNADADSKDIDSSIKAAEVIIKSAERLAEQKGTIADLEKERDHWKDRFTMLEKELEKYRHGGNSKGH